MPENSTKLAANIRCSYYAVTIHCRAIHQQNYNDNVCIITTADAAVSITNAVVKLLLLLCIVHKFKHVRVGGAGVAGWENGLAGEGK